MKLKSFLVEGMSSKDKEAIKTAMKQNKFLSLREPLKKAGFKVDFATSPIAYYTVQKGGETYVITNKKNAEGWEFEHKGIVMGPLAQV